ncbi:hypothetical protein H4Q26_017256 [Puccinia striiformis f. sp. tritici PST-130]|nr:hypothetical protein H4Q26_017256 [Puccinia striiformis f. sp. tritici PST-130]
MAFLEVFAPFSARFEPLHRDAESYDDDWNELNGINKVTFVSRSVPFRRSLCSGHLIHTIIAVDEQSGLWMFHLSRIVEEYQFFKTTRLHWARQFEGQNSKGVAKTVTKQRDAERILVKPDEMQPVEFSETSPGSSPDFSGVLRDFLRDFSENSPENPSLGFTRWVTKPSIGFPRLVNSRVSFPSVGGEPIDVSSVACNRSFVCSVQLATELSLIGAGSQGCLGSQRTEVLNRSVGWPTDFNSRAPQPSLNRMAQPSVTNQPKLDRMPFASGWPIRVWIG